MSKFIRSIAVPIIISIFLTQIIFPILVNEHTAKAESGVKEETWEAFKNRIKIQTWGNRGRKSEKQCSDNNIQKELNKTCTGVNVCKVGQLNSGWKTCCGCPGDIPCDGFEFCRFGICNNVQKKELYGILQPRQKYEPDFEYTCTYMKEISPGKRVRVTETFKPEFSKCEVIVRNEYKDFPNAKEMPDKLHAGCETHVNRCLNCGHMFFHHLHISPYPNDVTNIRVERGGTDSLVIKWDRNDNPVNTAEYAVFFDEHDIEIKDGQVIGKKIGTTRECKINVPNDTNPDKEHTIAIRPQHPDGRWANDINKGKMSKVLICATVHKNPNRDFFLPGEEVELEAYIVSGICNSVEVQFNSKELIQGGGETVLLQQDGDKGTFRGKVRISKDAPNAIYTATFSAYSACYRTKPKVEVKFEVRDVMDVNGSVVSLETAKELLDLSKDKFGITISDFLNASQEQLEKIKNKENDKIPIGETMVFLGKLHNPQYKDGVTGKTWYSKERDEESEYQLFLDAENKVKQVKKDTYYISLVSSAGMTVGSYTAYFKGKLDRADSEIAKKSKGYEIIEKEISGIGVNGVVVNLEAARKELVLPESVPITIDNLRTYATAEKLQAIINLNDPEKPEIPPSSKIPIGEQMVVIGKLYNPEPSSNNTGAVFYADGAKTPLQHVDFGQKVKDSNDNKISYYIALTTSAGRELGKYRMDFKGVMGTNEEQKSKPYELIDIGVKGAVVNIETARAKLGLPAGSATTIENLKTYATARKLQEIIDLNAQERSQIPESSKIPKGQQMVVIGKLYDPEPNPAVVSEMYYADGAKTPLSNIKFEEKVKDPNNDKVSYYIALTTSAGQELKREYKMYFIGVVGTIKKQTAEPYELLQPVIFNDVFPRIEILPDDRKIAIVWGDTNSHIEGVQYEVKIDWDKLYKEGMYKRGNDFVFPIPDNTIAPGNSHMVYVTPYIPGQRGNAGTTTIPALKIEQAIVYNNSGRSNFYSGDFAHFKAVIKGYCSQVTVKYDSRLLPRGTNATIICNAEMPNPMTLSREYQNGKTIADGVEDGTYNITFFAYASCYDITPEKERTITVGTILEVKGTVIRLGTQSAGDFAFKSQRDLHNIVTDEPDIIPIGEQMLVIGELWNPQYPGMTAQFEYANDYEGTGDSNYDLFEQTTQRDEYTYGFKVMTAQDLGPHTMHFKGTLQNGKTAKYQTNYRISDGFIETYSEVEYVLEIEGEALSGEVKVKEKAGYAIPISAILDIDTKVMKKITERDAETHEVVRYQEYYIDEYSISGVQILNPDGISCYVVRPNVSITDSDLQAGSIYHRITAEQCVQLIKRQPPSAKIGAFDFTEAHNIKMEHTGSKEFSHRAELTLQLPVNEEYGPKRQRAIYFDPNASDGKYSVIIEVESEIEFMYDAEGNPNSDRKEIKKCIAIHGDDAIIIEGSMYEDDQTWKQK